MAVGSRIITVSRVEYVKNVHEKDMPKRDIDLAWEIEADTFEERPADCPADRMFGIFTDEIPDDSELSICTYSELCEVIVFDYCPRKRVSENGAFVEQVSSSFRK